MELVVTINGKPVHSDKQMQSVVNTRVIFTDGSWCDVSSGVVHNVGSGYVSIGGSDSGSDAEKITVGPTRVAASALELNQVNADVRVDVHDGSDMEYTITGPADLVNTARTNVRGGDTLVIEGDNPGSSHAGSTIIQSGSGRTAISGLRGGGVVIGGSSVMSSVFGRGNMTTVVTGGGNDESEVKITVKVPRTTPITSDRVSGNVVIGDTEGMLVASVQANTVRAGRVGVAQLSVQGSGGISVKEVNGSAAAQVQGSGYIEIKSGNMPSLSATVQGSGGIAVGGSATTASLTVQGSGDINVAHVQRRPIESVMGSGDINVRRVG